MLTLGSAFRLCDIKDEAVFLSADGMSDEWFWSTKLANTVDMKKIEVVKIRPRFEHYGPDYLGMQFTVKGLTKDELCKLAYDCGMM